MRGRPRLNIKPGKSIQDKAEDERAKMEMKRLKLLNKSMDVQGMKIEQQRRAELRRLMA